MNNIIDHPSYIVEYKPLSKEKERLLKDIEQIAKKFNVKIEYGNKGN